MADGTDVTGLNYPTEAELANLDIYAWDRSSPMAQFKVQLGAGGSVGGGSGGSASSAREWDFNFTGDSEAVIRSKVARTITQASTTGTGSVSYQKSTTAAPNTFSATSSPVTLQAGAKLKIIATGVSGNFAVHLESD